MGAIGGLLGVNGGAGGTGFNGPAQADQTGMNNLNQSYNQLQQVAQGQGPNPAMAQYNQNVQNLAKQQSGAIASIQGISPALAARMASQQGSAALQNAAAQGATTQAEQQLGAMGAAGNIAGMQAGAANQMQGNINSVNMGLANQTMQNQAGLIGGAFGGAGAASAPKGGAASGGEAGVDFGGPSRQIQGSGMDVSGMAQPPAQNVTQSLLSKFLSGDITVQNQAVNGPAALQRGMTKFGESMASRGGSSQDSGAAPDQSNAMASPYDNGGILPSGNPMPPPSEGLGFARGGAVRAVVSPGEVYIPPGKVKQAAKGNPLSAGKKIPGKPKVPGNSYANDTVPKTLQAGGIVIPNSIMQSKNPAQGAKDFIADIISRRKAKK